jgi:hypothetical protein
MIKLDRRENKRYNQGRNPRTECPIFQEIQEKRSSWTTETAM